MHSMPRSSADILASATRAPSVVKQPRKPQKPRQPNPLASHPSFTTFPQHEPDIDPIDSVPRTVPELALTMTENIYRSSPQRTHYVPPVSFKFIPPFMTRVVSENPECLVQDQQVDSTSSSPPAPLERTRGSSPPHEPMGLFPEPTETCGSVQNESAEEALTVLRKNGLSPFDLIIQLLDESRPEYASYRNELYGSENTNLEQILDHVASSTAGRAKLKQIFCDSG